MYKVEIKDNNDNTGFWVYIVNQETGEKFMFRYVEFYRLFKDELKDKIKSDERDQAEWLIKFMRGE